MTEDFLAGVLYMGLAETGPVSLVFYVLDNIVSSHLDEYASCIARGDNSTALYK